METVATVVCRDEYALRREAARRAMELARQVEDTPRRQEWLARQYAPKMYEEMLREVGIRYRSDL